VTYETETGTIIIGSKSGVVELYSVDSQEPVASWKRKSFAVTSLATKTNSNGETVVCVSNCKDVQLKKKKLFVKHFFV
jgi:hypothetical protein